MGKFLVLVVVGSFGVLLALYLSLLGLQAYSARQASQILNQLDAIRLGDPVADFDKAVSGMRTEYGVHSLTAGAFRLDTLWEAAAKLPDQDVLQKVFYGMGLRYWRLVASANAQDGKLTAISVSMMVVGRYEMLGALWTLAPEIPRQYKEFAVSEDDRRTDMGWMHITSTPSGEGFESTRQARVLRRN